MCQLLQVIGSKCVQKKVFNDGKTIQNKYKDSEYLSTLNSKQFIKERNQLVISFICACANIRIEDQINENFIYAVAVALEMIYYLRDLNIILPHCFLINLVQIFLSASKTVSVLNGKVTPSCCYKSYKNWLELKGSYKLACPKNDVTKFFDNIGKYVIKNYRVFAINKSTAGVVTATLHFQMSSRFQKDFFVKPSA